MKISNLLRSESGFTLVELLIVIAIISILAGIVTLNVVQTAPGARDGRRAADIGTLETALEQYFSKEDNYVGACFSGVGFYCTIKSTEAGFLSTLMTAGYLKTEVTDPINNDEYYYHYVAAPGNAPTQYALWAEMEKRTSGENIYVLNDTSGTSLERYFYAAFSDYAYWNDHFNGTPTCGYSAILGGCLEKTWTD